MTKGGDTDSRKERRVKPLPSFRSAFPQQGPVYTLPVSIRNTDQSIDRPVPLTDSTRGKGCLREGQGKGVKESESKKRSPRSLDPRDLPTPSPSPVYIWVGTLVGGRPGDRRSSEEGRGEGRGRKKEQEEGSGGRLRLPWTFDPRPR